MALASIVVVARELGPLQFGLLAIVMLVNELLTLISEAGLSSALVQATALSKRQRATLYTAEWLLGITAVISMFALSDIIASAVGKPELRSLLQFVSFSILIESSARHVGAMLQRSMQFGKLVTAELARDAIRAFGSGVLVFQFGIWGVVFAHVAGSLVLIALLVRYGIREELFPGFGFHFRESRAIFLFGMHRAAAVGLNRIGQRADQAILAMTFAPASLGIYRLATQVTGGTLVSLQSITARVSFAMFSRQQHDVSLALNSFLRLIALQSFFTVPLTVGMILAAEPLIMLFVGPEWEGTSTLVALLALFYFLRLFEGSAIPLVNGLGEARHLMRWSAVTSVAYIGFVSIAATAQRIEVVAAVMLLVQASAVSLFYIVLVRPLVGSFGWRILSAAGPSIVCAIIASPALILIEWGKGVLSLPFSLIVCITVYGFIYLVASWFINRHTILVLLEAIPPSIRSYSGHRGQT